MCSRATRLGKRDDSADICPAPLPCCVLCCAGDCTQQDDACSAVSRSMQAYRELQLDVQQKHQLQGRQQQIQRRRNVLETQDRDGNMQEVKRVDDPDIVQVCSAAEY